MARLLIGAVVLATVSACTKDEDTDYCKNHYVYHFEHKDQLSTLNVEVAASGMVTADLVLKSDEAREFAGNPGLRQALLVADNVFLIQTEGTCTDATVSQTGGAQGGDTELASLSFESQCTAGEKIKQVDVRLFDTIPALDEVEATITTPATRKHFAVSRQCEGAIYRLGKKLDQE